MGHGLGMARLPPLRRERFSALDGDHRSALALSVRAQTEEMRERMPTMGLEVESLRDQFAKRR